MQLLALVAALVGQAQHQHQPQPQEEQQQATPLVTPHRPPPTTWRRSLCGTPSSVQPPTPDGAVEVGRDYPGDDVYPCGIHGCVMPPDSTIVDCKAKCSRAGLCGGVVFAAGKCSGRGGHAVCWTKSTLRSNASVPGTCRDSQVVGYEGVSAMPPLHSIAYAG